jgi:hypothetical protein
MFPAPTAIPMEAAMNANRDPNLSTLTELFPFLVNFWIDRPRPRW